jgi:excinuclease UvrABC ATPase subunit
MTEEFIEVYGARENNLKDVSLDIPKRKITVFTAQRQLNETRSITARFI